MGIWASGPGGADAILADVPGRILAIGGFSLGTRFDDVVLELARGPRVLFVPTAAGDPQRMVMAFYEAFSRRAEPSHLSFNPWPPEKLRDVVLAHDVVYVSGGNTANALAVWRVHGFDAILREAWERGALLCGWSAGMICWYEAGVTDSFGPALAGMRNGLGFLPGSACPHYDGEVRRRPGLLPSGARRLPSGNRMRRRRGCLLRGHRARRSRRT